MIGPTKGTAHIRVKIYCKSKSINPGLFDWRTFEFPVFWHGMPGFLARVAFKQARLLGITRWILLNPWGGLTRKNVKFPD